MLTTNECLNIDDYTFKSSPESCSGNSCFTDSTDFLSDEDFLQQLSADLDIPLLLNPGEDEMSLLNSFFDKSPEEIMSEIAFPSSPNEKFDDEAPDSPKWTPDTFQNIYPNIKVEPDSCSSSGSTKSASPVQSSDASIQFFEIKDEMKSEPHSPGTAEGDTKLLVSPCTSPKGKVVVLKSGDYKRPIGMSNVVSSPPPKVVVLENVATVPITTVASITTLSNAVISNCGVSPVIIKSSGLNVNNIDPRILKRQQRKIKNRESACLSRKKKKDYVTSLESQVKELSDENIKLKLENQQLAERLRKYEGPQSTKSSSSNAKTNIVLCMFLFSIALNFDCFKNPFMSKGRENAIESTPKVLGHQGRTLLWAPEEDLNSNNLSMCPAAINQTENARLTSDLERWIGIPKNANQTASPNITKLETYKSKSLRKRKPKKFSTAFISYNRDVGSKLAGVETNELQVFSPIHDQLYSEFFEAINRQDDTFYVVSFSDHHMLLPALHHNKTRRPKMSLIMPSVLPNENITKPSLIPLMQIDCEVLDTRLIQVRSGSIPRHLRRNNETMYQNDADVSKQDDKATNYTTKKAYKPYFIKRKSINGNDDRDLYNIR